MHIVSFITFFTLALILCALLLIISYFLGERPTNLNTSSSKNIPFESGVNPIKQEKLQFFAKFYLLAMSFVIFDIESIYIYTWATIIREANWIGFIEAIIFIVNLLVSLLYLIKKDVLNWKSLSNKKQT
ncbi:NADH-quinone oxidoreductase subunit A [Candidatus Westeberhardia cardiocondylae]|uniref:NADH-quinone oxidoreductase subunit n=1 Tax=Candidatus Westeberhardia cardiocondylae TaxID=1594731 RepID=A0A0H5BX74_9ENTR|nr:NADH-quinone oxidoreductase subunit A [Candidatus Westeberhardia cardiocondylae]MCR3756212.1 NADH:quinone oxidoreductase subunit A [Candidatus Westeberhardia cardiocondylae]CEN32318.1 NADH-quinone oxidoreductase subunit A [Candidatus Westeberhardia cardiocondylae]